MRNLLIISSCLILFGSCKEQENGKGNQQESATQKTDTLKSFSVIEKDSAYLITFRLYRQSLSDGIIAFNYSDGSNDFVLWCDTAKKIYKGVFTKADTITLDLEAEKFYTVNGKDFKLLKLVRDKGVTDGEISYFFSIDIGLLVSKSNTWRIGKILNPDKSRNDYVQLTALLYKVLTDEEMFKNPIPESKIKFTPPKVE
jgi:hypothetical protein